MKYDSGMVHFRKDIVTAIKFMLGGDKNITERFSKDDGSPAPLRDYIKDNYRHRGGSNADGIRYSCSTTKGMDITLVGRVLNNNGDNNLTLSWSQVAKFVRDNWDDIFSEDEDEDEETSNKTALETLVRFFDESEIKCPCWETGSTLKFLSIGGIEFKCKQHTQNFCELDTITRHLAAHCHNHTECRYYQEVAENYATVSDNNSDKFDSDSNNSDLPCVCEDKQVPVFDYAALDTNTAQSLKSCENVIRQQTAEYFTVIGAQLKDAQTLLANHSNGTFEQWYTSLGFKRQTVYNLIQRFDFISSPALGGREEAFEALPVTLSYEISKPDAPKELVEKVLDGDITTNAEYKKLKTELELTKTNLRNVERNFDEREKLRQKLGDENVQLRIKIKEQDKELKSVSEKDTEISSLRHRIEELENRPVDVAVQVDEKALAEKDEEIAELREELEKLQDKKYKPFLIKLTVEEWEELIRVTEMHANRAISTAVKTAKIVRF